MNYIGDILKFVLDGTKHIALRVSIPFVLIVSALSLNDYYGVSRNYLLNRKLEQLSDLKSLDSEIANDTLFINTLFRLKVEILIDKSIINLFGKTRTYSKKGKEIS